MAILTQAGYVVGCQVRYGVGQYVFYNYIRIQWNLNTGRVWGRVPV